MASALTLVDRVVEFYTLRRAAGAQEKLGPARAEIAELAELGRQRASAAEALFAVGHTVEALRLAVESLDALKQAAARLGEAAGAPRRALARAAEAPAASPPPPPAADAEAAASAEAPDLGEATASEAAPEPEAPALEPWWRAALRAAAVSAATQEATEATLARAETAALPRLESGITPAHATLFRDVMRARTALESAVAPATLSRAEIRFTRGWRPLVTAVLVVGIAIGAVRALTPVEGTFTRASATWADSPDFQPERAIDGNDATMWILPDGQSGFLEVRFVPGRRIERVSLINAGNATVIDRGTNEYALELWVDGAVARSIDGTFADAPGSAASHEVGLDDVERIRFIVRSHNRLSGGLSELRWE